MSWYHLLLDCAALLLLWKELRLSSSLQKILVTSGCAAASLLFSMLGSSLIGQYGLCGFSGTAHGLTFLLGIKWIAESQEHRQTDQGLLIFSGLLFIGASAGKSMIEFISGNVIFSNMHIGDLGIPIVESHLGGVIGGLIAFLTLRAMKQKPFDLPRKLSDNQNRGPVIYNKDLNPQISTRIVDIR